MEGKSLIMIALLALTTTAAEAQSVQGRDDFMRYCSACHGEAADGQGPVANILTPRPPALTSLRGKFGHPLGTRFVAYVMGTSMTRAHGTSDMPVWGKVLAGPDGSDERAVGTIWRIAAYLESIQTR